MNQQTVSWMCVFSVFCLDYKVLEAHTRFSISFVILMFSKWKIQGRSVHETKLELSALSHWPYFGPALGKGQLSVKRKQSHEKSSMKLEKILTSEFVAWLVLCVLFP